jgi:1-acyl-sn-glycerol-3-phosphate acyltransferase
MLPIVDAVYPAAKAVFWPWLRFGLRWTIEGESNIPARGPTILASNHVSYLDPLTMAWLADGRGRRVRFLAKAELFRKRGLGPLLRAAHQIPVYRGTADSSGALSAAIEALRKGECVAVFPEGTISLDLEPMRGKSGTARLAQASGVAVVPVGLWGTHRMMMKGRKPHWAWGVAQVAVVGEPVRIAEGEHVKDATVRIMDAITDCVARARAIYPQRPGPGDDAWWWRDPDTATAHRRPA